MSSDESDFEGFNASEIGSDIDVDVSDVSSVSDVSDVSSVDLSDDENDFEADWTGDFSDIQFDEFRGQHGPVLPDDFDVITASPIEYFWLMMNPLLFDAIANHTNRYAQWKQAQQGAVDPRWVDTSPDEIRALMAINIMMGINILPEADMYWSSSHLVGNQGIQSVMTCNRYQKLNQYLHVSDRTTEPQRNQPGYDRLYKVRPIIDHLTDSFTRTYVLSREVAVDEAMVRYTGRLSFRQYMPAKPIKRGIKVWMLCDSNTHFLSRFEVYLGRQNNMCEHGLGHNVVMRLTEGIRQSNRHVFFDNFFTGVPLMTALLANGLYACGTIRVNRKGFPEQLKKPRTLKNRGQFLVLQKGATNLTASVWKDKRLVHQLSTLSNPTEQLDARRRVGPDVVQLQQPHCAHAYNQFMGGVDTHDQLRTSYGVGRNSKKWWKYLFWFLLNCAIVNAFIMYKAVSQRRTRKKRYTHLDFRLELVGELIAGYTRRKRSLNDQEQVPMVPAQNIGGHVYGKLSDKPRRCRYHMRVLNQRTETKYGCTVCRVHLCKNGCHQRFHNMDQ